MSTDNMTNPPSSMLAHKPKNVIEAAYDRSLHLERRREIAQDYADRLMEGLTPARELIGL